MNLPPPSTKFINTSLQGAKETCKVSMAKAVHMKQLMKMTDVAVEGSSQKRGFSSKNDVVTVTSVETGKVIDVEMLSKHCVCPSKINHP
ncbi:hypothetical protein NPIL_521301 [Nephila pilipes]|uniref:Mutator-like transposase domain-containing protein n=1 Tax=Nephila pilipes TaxID=299642 RepID=A0A8X6NG96_NEPPI|nr:hypothetical protein NPIL_521301 [Nephila pilipes]